MRQFFNNLLDNPTYYSLAVDRRYSVDNTGCCGGNYNAHDSVAQDLILEALVDYRDTMGVDGFRFDQAPILGNTCDADCYRFDPQDPSSALARITREIHPRDVSGNGTDLIAEPWAAGSYQAGQFPPGWSEWNDLYRNTVKASQNGRGAEAVTPNDLALRLSGSSDRFQGNDGKPSNSINYLTSHDELPLADTYSCNNQDKIAWDQGDDVADQLQAARTGFALLLLSAGTPMFTGGDEFLRSLHCQINPYNLDTAENWLNFTWDAEQREFNTFIRRLIGFRTAHEALRPANFYSGSDHNGNGIEDLAWFGPDGTRLPPLPTYLDNSQANSIAFRVDGTEFNDTVNAIYIAYNGRMKALRLTLPSPGPHNLWYRVMDTAIRDGINDTIVSEGKEAPVGGALTTYNLANRSILVLIAKNTTCLLDGRYDSCGEIQPHNLSPVSRSCDTDAASSSSERPGINKQQLQRDLNCMGSYLLIYS